MTISDNKHDNRHEYKPKRGRPKGLRRITRLSHGAFCKNPIEALDYWKVHNPPVAESVEHTFETFRCTLGWSLRHPLAHELRCLCIAIASRDLMHGEVLEHDFKMAVRDPKTHGVVRFRAHHLIEPVLTFDAKIQQKLIDFGLIHSQFRKRSRIMNDMMRYITTIEQ